MAGFHKPEGPNGYRAQQGDKEKQLPCRGIGELETTGK